MNQCMDHQTGIVKEINGDKAVLSFHRASACEKCGACGLLSKSNEMVMIIPNNGYSVGDRVLISIETRYFIMSAFLLYVLPLIGLLAGIIISSALGVEQIIAAVIGVASATALLFILKLFQQRFESMKNANIRFIKMD